MTFSQQIISNRLLQVVIGGQKSSFISKFKLEPITIYQQEEHQSTMVEVEGMIVDQPIFFLIGPGVSLSYISPQMVEKCNL